MPGQPCLDLGGVVGGVVVTHQVHLEFAGYGLVDGGQELAELDGVMAAVQCADDGAVGDVEGRVPIRTPSRSVGDSGHTDVLN